MKKILPIFILAFTVLFCAVQSTDRPVFANEFTNATDNEALNTVGIIYRAPYRTGTGNLTTSWTQVAKTNTNSGMNMWIRLNTSTSMDCDVDVRMKDKNNKVIWSENKAFHAANDGYREFWCGKNVYSVEAKISTGNPFVALYIKGSLVPFVTEYNISHKWDYIVIDQ